MDYLPDVIAAAQEAAKILSSHFYRGFSHSITTKSDLTPVTQADMAANEIITQLLNKIDPSIPILSEENPIPDFAVRQTWKKYWLIDPLDGTRGFIKRSDEFCINIALIENHRAIFGLIYAPIQQAYCYAQNGAGAFYVDLKKQVTESLSHHPSPSQSKTIRFLTGHFDQVFQLKKRIKQLQAHFGSVEVTQMNSALKMIAIARDQADIYLRLGETSEWDIAAGQCILEEIGGAVVDFQGNSLQYNAKSSLINPPFIAVRDVRRLEKCIAFVKKMGEG